MMESRTGAAAQRGGGKGSFAVNGKEVPTYLPIRRLQRHTRRLRVAGEPHLLAPVLLINVWLVASRTVHTHLRQLFCRE